jgi:hypothetical protein
MFLDLVYNELQEALPYLNWIPSHGQALAVLLRSLLTGAGPTVGLMARLVLFWLTRGKWVTVRNLLGEQRPEVEGEIPSREAIAEFLQDLAPEAPPTRCADVADAVEQIRSASGIGATAPSTLMGEGTPSEHSLIETQFLGETEADALDQHGKTLLDSGWRMVVFGHTHLVIDGDARPPRGPADPRRLYNTGCWLPTYSLNPTQVPSLRSLAEQTPKVEVWYLLLNFGDEPKACLRSLQVDG